MQRKLISGTIYHAMYFYKTFEANEVDKFLEWPNFAKATGFLRFYGKEKE